MGPRPRFHPWLTELSLFVDRFWVAAAVIGIAIAFGFALTYVPGPAFNNATEVVRRKTVHGTVLYSVLTNPKLLHAHRRYTVVVQLDDERMVTAASFSSQLPDRGSRVMLERIDHAIGAPVYNVLP